MNLLENAIEYSAPGSDSQVGFDGAQYRPFAKRGQRIPATDPLLIFERFYKGDRAGSPPGSGLGLAIVKRTVLAHRGRV